ncbi:MAG: hypothetical protein EHM19_04750, partial [Candidatus Latescibacterota bacterium]
MNHRFRKIGWAALLLGMAVASQAFAYAFKPEVVIGPGIDTGRTPYHQNWNRILDPDTLYTLTGIYYVDSTYSITIPAGTIVQGDTAATLIVSRGARIHVNGTAADPVVFTSRKSPGARARGDWGGVVLLGDAPCNKVDPLIEGGIIGGTYGGSNAAHDIGEFYYARIEYPGYRFQLNNEVNGLTMGAVGSGSEIHHVQVSYSFDDAFEWFGGTVDCDYLVAFGTTDDEFDTDFGYQGKIQFAYGQKDPNLWDPTGETNGFETDNDASGSGDVPFTGPTFSNVTLIGPARQDTMCANLPTGNKHQYAGLIRRQSHHKIFNSVLGGFRWGFSIRDAGTIACATGTPDSCMVIRCTSLAACENPSGSTSVHDEGRWAGVTSWYDAPWFGNTGSVARNLSALGLGDMSDFTDPNPVPQSGSELINSACFGHPYLGGFQIVTYRGAFDPALPMNQQWTESWTNFDPQTTDYNPCFAGVEESAPVKAGFSRSVPNPFNPTTTISCSIPRAGLVTVDVYDAAGNHVRKLHEANESAGVASSVIWDGKS